MVVGAGLGIVMRGAEETCPQRFAKEEGRPR
jgi:hypothetical protein